jgi:hypothetical protein
VSRSLSQLTVGPGTVVQTLTSDRVAELCEEWLVAYPADRNGINVEQFMWHVFSFERYPSLARAAAFAEYEK